MADLKEFVSLTGTNLTANDEHVLRKEVLKLEEKCEAQFRDSEPEDLRRRLWIHLVELSVELQNVHLSLLAVAKLKLAQLALLLHSTLRQKTPLDEDTKLLALYYVASYFGMSTTFETRLTQIWSSAQQEHLLELFINSGRWTSAIDFIDSSSMRPQEKELKKRLIYRKLALHLELEGNYPEALENYERSGGPRGDVLRVLLKQHKNLAFGKLRSCCLPSGGSSRSFWFDFLLSSGGRLSASEKNELRCDYRLSLASSFRDFEKSILAEIPEKVKSFFKDTDPSKWADRRRIDYIISYGASLNSDTRLQLAHLASRYQETNSISKACNLYLCLDQLAALFYLSPRLMDRASSLKLVYHYGDAIQLASSLISFERNAANNDHSSRAEETRRSKESALLFVSYMRLGLIDEALNMIAAGWTEDEAAIVKGIEHLEGSVEKRFACSLDDIDPVIEGATLVRVLNTRKRQVFLTHVITIVILAITVLLNKMENNPNKAMKRLESMFSLASECFVGPNFATSDALIRSMGVLVEAVKDKLDLLADYDAIRDAFRQMVLATADRCMIEGRYKSAAMLYNHIEDYKSAVKSLMRMGDLEVVINYSLLVRDITVNRITINYLKHLNADQAIIKDFIARSQT